MAERSHMALIDAALERARAKAVAAPKPTRPKPRRLPPKRVPSVLAIRHHELLAGVCEAYRLTLTELCGNDRHKTIAEARHVACWLLRKSCGLSYPELGELMSGRDHTTARSSVLVVDRRRSEDARFRSFTNGLLTDLSPVNASRCSVDGEACSKGGTFARVW